MSEMVERIARRLSRADDPDGREYYHLNPRYWTCLAVAALREAREPTADMVLAALAVQPKSLKLGACIVSAKYAAMIDEALKASE